MTYRVHFSGMIAFVPEKADDADPTKIRKMRLLFLDGRPPHQAPGGEELTPHFAFIRFRLTDLAAESPRRPDLVGHNGYGVCFLNNEELKLDGGGESLDATLSPHAYGSAPPSTDLGWLLPVAEACGNAKVKVRPDLTKHAYKIPSNGPSLLTARALIGSGKMYTCGFRRTTIAGQSLPATCSFHAPTKDDPDKADMKKKYCEQALATEVTWEPAHTSRPQLVIQSKRFDHDGGEGGSILPLRFRPTNAGEVIDIDCWNATLTDLLDQLQGPEDVHDWYTPQSGNSFRSFYRAVAGDPPATLPVFYRGQRVAAGVGYDAPCRGKNPGCPCAVIYKA